MSRRQCAIGFMLRGGKLPYRGIVTTRPALVRIRSSSGRALYTDYVYSPVLEVPTGLRGFIRKTLGSEYAKSCRGDTSQGLKFLRLCKLRTPYYPVRTAHGIEIFCEQRGDSSGQCDDILPESPE